MTQAHGHNFEMHYEAIYHGRHTQLALNFEKCAQLCGLGRARIAVTRSYSDRDSDRKATLEMLAEYPQVRCIVGVADVSILGAYEAVVSLGLDQGDMCLVGIDATQEALRMIGQSAAIRGSASQSTRAFALAAVDAALAAVNGSPADTVLMPIAPVTADNLDEYLAGALE